jgi:hypothetical protein
MPKNTKPAPASHKTIKQKNSAPSTDSVAATAVSARLNKLDLNKRTIVATAAAPSEPGVATGPLATV